MKISAPLIAIALSAGLRTSSAVDLTPRYIDTFEAGVAGHRLYFSDGEKKIGISLGRETDVIAAAGGVIFRFPKFPEASFLVKHSPVTADQPFSGVPLDRYREAARRLLPPGSTEVKALDETRDPLTINRWRSYRLACTFAAGGTPMVQQVTFLNLSADEQLVLVTTASERNFAEVAARSFQIIRSWQPMLPGDEKPVRQN